MVATNESTQLLPLAQAAREFLGRELSPATLWRWVKKGVRGTRLKVVRVGGRIYVSRAALAEFADETTASANCTTPAQPPERTAATAARLRAAGLS